MRFLDTNVIIRYLTQDDPVKAEACRLLFERVADGSEEVLICEAVVTEIAYVLSSRRLPYQLSHEAIHIRLTALLMLPGINLPQKRVYLRALEIYGASPFLDIEDAVTAAHMEQHSIDEIWSYDSDFDRLPRIRRLEP